MVTRVWHQVGKGPRAGMRVLRHGLAYRNSVERPPRTHTAVKKKKTVNDWSERKPKQESRIILENHQAKFLWIGARKGKKSKHFDNVNNLAIKTYCHNCSLNKNTTKSNRLRQERRKSA